MDRGYSESARSPFWQARDITPGRVVMHLIRHRHHLSIWKKKKHHSQHSDSALPAGMDSGSCSAASNGSCRESGRGAGGVVFLFPARWTREFGVFELFR